MADVSKIFKPRRGKKSTMAGTKKTTVLSNGEMFIEVPDTGSGTGHSRMKIGDGSTAYSDLPYAMGDTENDEIAFSSNTSTTVATALNSVTSGGKLKNLIAGLKQAVSLCSTSITQLNDDISNHTHDDRYYSEAEIDNKISTLKTSFQTGVDTIYNGCKTYGSTPTAKTPSSIVEAIKAIYNNRYNSGRSQGQYDVKNNPSAYGLGTNMVKSGTLSTTKGNTYTVNCGFKPDIAIILSASKIVASSSARYAGSLYLSSKNVQINFKRSSDSEGRSAMNAPSSSETNHTMFRSILSTGFTFYVYNTSVSGSETYWIAIK